MPVTKASNGVQAPSHEHLLTLQRLSGLVALLMKSSPAPQESHPELQRKRALDLLREQLEELDIHLAQPLLEAALGASSIMLEALTKEDAVYALVPSAQVQGDLT